MSKERRIKTIERSDGKARLFILARDDGLFRFEGESEQGEDGDVFWALSESSGLYESAEGAEHEARRTVPWLRDESSDDVYSGMTVNERLFAAGLLNEFDAAVRDGIRSEMIELLGRVELGDEAADIVDKIMAHPTRYGRITP
jgi:hypothetical protein